MVRPESVLYMTKEISGFNENGNANYFKENFKITDDNEIKTWINKKNEKGLYLVDWEKVKDNYIECNELYNKYLNAGFVCSKIAMSKKLYPLGIVSSVKKIDGRAVNVYVGIC
jgi:hypothetical protein